MLRQVQLRWSGYLERMDDERLPKRLFYGVVATARCQRIFRARIGLFGHLRTQCTNNPTIPISTSNSANPPSDSHTLTPGINSITPTIIETTSLYSSPVTLTKETTTALAFTTTTTTTISDGDSLLNCPQCDRTFTSCMGLITFQAGQLAHWLTGRRLRAPQHDLALITHTPGLNYSGDMKEPSLSDSQSTGQQLDTNSTYTGPTAWSGVSVRLAAFQSMVSRKRDIIRYIMMIARVLSTY
ncbi:unnamed protein product [Schistocephalus solidus]|uniref:C2H2-type domain-containing protein n=1 Tax=Schistocephalus solidus TaxID=70667 RepID=A0A183STZ5_SCHSO|nr:unnamed protein product [Schistocephalus solidus]